MKINNPPHPGEVLRQGWIKPLGPFTQVVSVGQWHQVSGQCWRLQ